MNSPLTTRPLTFTNRSNEFANSILLTYTRPDSKLQVIVTGVPADVCNHCGEAYLSEEIAQEIFDLVDEILGLGKTLKAGNLPIPEIEIRFQTEDRKAA